jgi:hypothetical protein
MTAKLPEAPEPQGPVVFGARPDEPHVPSNEEGELHLIDTELISSLIAPECAYTAFDLIKLGYTIWMNAC